MSACTSPAPEAVPTLPQLSQGCLYQPCGRRSPCPSAEPIQHASYALHTDVQAANTSTRPDFSFTLFFQNGVKPLNVSFFRGWKKGLLKRSFYESKPLKKEVWLNLLFTWPHFLRNLAHHNFLWKYFLKVIKFFLHIFLTKSAHCSEFFMEKYVQRNWRFFKAKNIRFSGIFQHFTKRHSCLCPSLSLFRINDETKPGIKWRGSEGSTTPFQKWSDLYTLRNIFNFFNFHHFLNILFK